jgi:hypothetical protein
VSSEEGWVEGNDAHTLAEAVNQAVDDANQPEGTILKVDVYVRSVGDPNVGAYKAIVTPL